MVYDIRRLKTGDEKILDDFLRAHTPEAYYLRSNALAVGLKYNGNHFEGEYIGAFSDGRLVGALGYFWINTIMLYTPEIAAVAPMAEALKPLIAKRSGVIEGFLGLATLVDELIRCLGIPQTAFRSKPENDGLFVLDVPTIKIFKNENRRIRYAEERDAAQLIDWRISFGIESLNAKPGAEQEKKVVEEITRRTKDRELFVLEEDEKLLSFCALAGAIPDSVIVGSVWTPPEMRKRGLAKEVVSRGIDLLAQEKPKLESVVLFASRPDAIRVYESVGFKRIGNWGFGLLREDYRFG